MRSINKSKRCDPEYIYHQRIMVAFLIVSFLMFVMFARMAWIKIVKADEYRDMAINQQKSHIQLEAKRGSIYDRNKNELVASAKCFYLYIRTAAFKDSYKGSKRTQIISKLAKAIGESEEYVKNRVTSNVPVLRLGSYYDTDQIKAIRKLKVQGLDVTTGTRRHYPLGSFAASVLGSVTLENSGRSGLELQYDDYLSGVAGKWIKTTDVNGDAITYGDDKKYGAQDGLSLVLTIDEILQHHLENAVAQGMKETKADRIMAVAMNPKSGEILAMVNTPTFDPNNASMPTDPEAKKAFEKMSDQEQTDYLSKLWRNPVISDTYEPGSVFKLITTASAIEEGIATPNSVFYCAGYEMVAGVRISCWSPAPHGSLTLKDAIGVSCNPVQMKLAASLGKDKYYDYLDMFGITRQTGVDMPGEAISQVLNKENVGPVELATMSFGQGIAVTPMQMVTAISAIGNDGVLMKPHIVKKLIDSSGKVVKEFKPQAIRKVISSKPAKDMCEMMEAEVSTGGGGTAKIPGMRVGGKTGTSEKAIDGKYTNRTDASFVCMAPMDDPKIALLVVVDYPKNTPYGATAAGPIAKNFLENALQYLGVSRVYSEDEVQMVRENTISVPSVIGKAYEDATGVIKGAGLEAKLDSGDPNDKGLVVLDQNPKPGKNARKGEVVHLYLE